jgi:hypothetical protein
VILHGREMIRFWGALYTTTGFIVIMDTDDFLPDKDFFPDISIL